MKSAGIPSGCPKRLASLIREGKYDPSRVCEMTVSELRSVCSDANLTIGMSATKVRAFDYAVWLHVSSCARSLQPQMLVQLEALHSYILQGESECHMFTAAPACSGGKVFKNCHHQVSLPPPSPHGCNCRMHGKAIHFSYLRTSEHVHACR